MFDDEFIDNLPDNPEDAAYRMCEKFREVDSSISSDKEIDCYSEYYEAFGAMEEFIKMVGISIEIPLLAVDKKQNILIIRQFYRVIFQELETRALNLKVTNTRDKFKLRFGSVFLYQFSDGDLKRIQELINELRNLSTDSEIFDARHKERILKKLESLQMELHKKMSSLDKLWGLIGEAGVALGKFGKDAKPFVDRVREIAQITWRTQARAEELPSGTTLPLLSHEQKENCE
jgi:hypothetical protein